MTFVTWGYRSSDILLLGPASGFAANVDDLIAHPVWNLYEVTYATFKHPRPMITYYLWLFRKPRYIVSSIILPLIVLIVLNVCVFILPGGSGEKASYAITVFLSFVVFSTLVHETLPVNSENVCFLSVFITAEVFQSAVITILAVLLIRFERRTDPVPRWLRYMVSLTCFSLNRRTAKAEYPVPYSLNSEGKKTSSDIMQTLDEHHFNDNGKAKLRQEHVVKIKRDNLDWGTVVYRIDLILFVAFLTVNVLLTLISFITIMNIS